LDPFSEFGVGFDEVDEVPYTSFFVGLWVFNRVYSIATERLLVVGSSGGVSGKGLVGETICHA
jgi:hypothetical protein